MNKLNPKKVSLRGIRLIAEYLYENPWNEFFLKWDKRYHYNVQVCFKHWDLEDIQEDDKKAREWFEYNYDFWKSHKKDFEELLLRIMELMLLKGDLKEADEKW